MPLRFLKHRDVVHRAHLYVRLQWISDLDAPGLFHNEVHKVLVDAPVNENPLGGAAHLTRIEVGSEGGCFRGTLEVGVFQNDLRSVTAKFHQKFFDTSATLNGVARGCFARQTNSVEARVRHKGISRGGAVSGNQIEDSRRKFGFSNTLRKQKAGEGRLLRRFKNDRVSRSQTRPEIFGGNHGGKVPRRDNPPRADGNLERKKTLVRIARRDNWRFQSFHVLCSNAEIFGGFFHLGQGLRNVRLALFERNDCGDFFLMRENAVRDTVTGGGAVERRGQAPILPSTFSRLDCAVHVEGRSLRNPGQYLARRRTLHDQLILGVTRNPFSANEQLPVHDRSEDPLNLDCWRTHEHLAQSITTSGIVLAGILACDPRGVKRRSSRLRSPRRSVSRSCCGAQNQQEPLESSVTLETQCSATRRKPVLLNLQARVQSWRDPADKPICVTFEAIYLSSPQLLI